MQKGDIFCRQEPTTGRYFAFQIIRPGKPDDPDSDTAYLLLDYFDEHQPQESDLKGMKPFINNRWFFEGKEDYLRADTADFPKDAQWVGNIPPLKTGVCNRFGNWRTGRELIAEQEWLEIPEEQRRRFKEALSDTSEITIGGEAFRRNKSHICDSLLSVLTDFEKELYDFPAAYGFNAERYYPQLIPFLETRQTCQGLLTWKNHHQKSLDLSKTYLGDLKLDADGLLELILPRKCIRLTLMGKIHPDLRIRTQDDGEKLAIVINVSEQEQIIPDLKLPTLRRLVIEAIDNVDLSRLPDYYPRLDWLRLDGRPGNVSGVEALGRLSELESLMMKELFGFTYDEFPQPGSNPKLQKLWLESVPQEAGVQIKKAFKGKLEKIGVTKLRKPEWLAENLTNPLRHWDGSEFVPASKAKKAFQIYRDFRRAALAAAQDFLTDKNASKLSASLDELAKEYVLAFNKLNGRNGFIETDEREDICAAFDVILRDVQELASETGFKIDADRIEEIMDEHRDW